MVSAYFFFCAAMPAAKSNRFLISNPGFDPSSQARGVVLIIMTNNNWHNNLRGAAARKVPQRNNDVVEKRRQERMAQFRAGHQIPVPSTDAVAKVSTELEIPAPKATDGKNCLQIRLPDLTHAETDSTHG